MIPSLFALAFASSGCAAHAGSAQQQLEAGHARSLVKPASPQRQERDALRGPVLERADFVRAVLAANPSVEAARQGWRAALARVRQAGAFEDPMLDVGLAPLSLVSSKASVGYEIAISQHLPWFGKRSLEASMAAAEAEAARSDYDEMKRELALSALALYDRYFVSVRSLEINATHVQLMRALRDNATAQFGSGHGSAQDSLQAEAELTHMEHDAVTLASQRDVLVAQMNELLHRSAELALPPPAAALNAPAAREQSPNRLQSEAAETRPDIRALRQRSRAEQARAERAEREYLPDFTVSTSYNSMWDMPEHRWMLGLGFNLPIQRGKRAAAADEARALRAQVESEIARLTDTARTQVFVGLRKLQESQHVLVLFETRLLPVAIAQIDAARAGFVTSQNSFSAVIEAERNLRRVELDYQMAHAEHAQRQSELQRALGRIPGLEGEEVQP
ncbi:MAG: TolC family protein [Polyangiaceae bacterium]